MRDMNILKITYIFMQPDETKTYSDGLYVLFYNIIKSIDTINLSCHTVSIFFAISIYRT